MQRTFLLLIKEYLEHPITTVLGLLGLVGLLVYLYMRQKQKRAFDMINDMSPDDKARAYEQKQNEVGLNIDTSKLTPPRQAELARLIINAKTKKYLIFAIAIVILAIVAAFMFKTEQPLTGSEEKALVNQDTVKTVMVESAFEDVNEKVKQCMQLKGLIFSNDAPDFLFAIECEPMIEPNDTNGTPEGNVGP